MKTITMTIASLSVGAALVLGGTVAAQAATPSPSPSAPSCTVGQRLVHGWLELPKALRSDLKAAKKDGQGAERRAELKSIRAKALSGGYGATVEAHAKQIRSLHLRPVPDALKADLKTLHGEKTRADKVAEAQKIGSNALAGDYGSNYQKLAQQIQSRAKDCTTKGSGS